MKINLAALAAFVLVAGFEACQKEPDESLVTPPTPKCSLEKSQYFDQNGGTVDTAGFVYSGQNVSRVNYLDYFTTLEYSNNRISKRSYFDYALPNFPVGHDAYTYNADGTLSKAELFIEDTALNVPLLFQVSEFSYTSGKLSTLITKIDTGLIGSPAPLYQYDYSYTGNNISRCISLDMQTNEKDTFDYQYDTKPSYFAKLPAYLYTDYIVADLSGEVLPLAFSTNNVVVLKQNGISSNLTYVADANDNLSELRVDGQLIAKYFHKCQ